MRNYALNLLATRGASLDTFVATGASCACSPGGACRVACAWSDPPALPSHSPWKQR